MTTRRAVLTSVILVVGAAVATAGVTGAAGIAATSARADSTVPSTPGAWETIDAPGNCMCSDASPFKFFVRRAGASNTASTSSTRADKVLFFFEGGGACFNEETCITKPSYTVNLAKHDPQKLNEGIWDLANPANPFSDYSVVYVPYCTGDVHIGNKAATYGYDKKVVRHNGYLNGTSALMFLAQNFPNATQVVVAGESAGSIPTPLYAGLVHDALPQAQIVVLADGSGGYPDLPLVNATIGDAWGTPNAVPAWKENVGMTPEKWSIPGLFVQAYRHDSAIVFGRHDYAFDATQVSYSKLAGLPDNRLDLLMDKNESQIESAGAKLSTFLSPGHEHTVLSKNDFYTETTNGTKLVDWVRTLIGGTAPGDVHCTACAG